MGSMPMLRPRPATAAAACAAALVLAGCSSETPPATTPSPSANEIIDAFSLVRGADDQPFLAGPVLGSGTGSLKTFTAPESGYSVVVRCFGSVDVSVSDPAAVDEELNKSDGADLDPGGCTDEILRASRLSTGGPVAVATSGDEDASWVAGVTTDGGSRWGDRRLDAPTSTG